jgi:hypothetical protein
MNEFILIFRMNITTKSAQPTPQQMKIYMKQWEKWIKGIAAKGRLAEGGNHLSAEGRVLKPKNETIEGPYTSKKESVAGYILILAKDLDDAAKIAKKCPILNGEGTSVEIREITVR